MGLPANPTPAAAAKSKKMKRVSSISSLLSAYSNTSSDSVQRSSQGSIFTKDSEPSNSPEREGMNDIQQALTKTLPVLPSNPYEDELFLMTDEKIAADLPPPPPLKDATRPSTPQSARPQGPTRTAAGAQDGNGSAAESPTLSSPQRREIWRRRASSSKSDAGFLIPELKLAVSHGSTASTAQPANSETAANPDLLPPPPAQSNNSSSNSTANSPLPPRSGSLPGRNIRPNRQTEPQEDSEMRKFSAKLKGLAGRGDEKDSDSRKGESVATSAAPPMQDRSSVEGNSATASKTSVETAVFSPAPAPTPAPIPAAAPSLPMLSFDGPPKESGEKAISRRPVRTPGPAQPEVQKGSSSDMRKPKPPPIGLPRGPRPSQSTSSLRSPSVPYTVQDTVRPRVSPQAAPPPVTMPSITLPADAKEPIKKPELFNIVTALNEPRVSPDSTATRVKPPRKVSRDIDATNLSDIGEATEQMTPEQMQQINEALSRFPRAALQSTPPADSVWQAAPLAEKHFNCYARHARWVPVKNTNYPLSCQTCEVRDASARKTCSFCSLRICFKCHERLTGVYKYDLKELINNLDIDQHIEKLKEKDRLEKEQEKGKQKDAA